MKKKRNTVDSKTMNKEKSENTEPNNQMNPNDTPIDSNSEEVFDEKETTNQTNNGLEELQKKNNELNDKYLRLYSEFDNYRKRTIKEKVELNKMASMEVILSFLPIIDDFDRAIKTIEETSETNAFNEGVLLIYAKFKKTLNQHGVEEMKTIGELFNTDLHEAITNIPATSDDMKGKIADEIQKGYLLNGKVIRYAKVVIAN